MIKWIGQHIWDFISRFRNDVYLEDLSDPGSDTDKFLVVDDNNKVGYRTGAEVLSDIGGSGGGATTFTLTADGGSDQTISNGNTLTITGGNAISTTVSATDRVTVNHENTSSQASVDNSGRTYIQDVTLDTYGHVTGLVSATETVTDTTYSEATSSDAGLMSTAHHDKLDGIAAGAEVNVNADWNSVSGDSEILNKPTIPSGNQIIDWTVSQGATDIHADNYTNTTYSEATSSSEGLMSTAHHDKLDGIEANADVTDTANVTSAGALMDSEVDADIKTLSLPANTTISTFGASLVDDADAAAARTTLGVDASGTDNSTNVTLAGTPEYITISGQEITRNQIDLTADVTGVLPFANQAGYISGEGINVIGNVISAEDASDSNKGVVELATTAETTTGTSTSLAVTPDGLKDGYQGTANIDTLGTITSGTWEGSVIAEAYLQNQSGTNTGDEPDASTSTKGIVELATTVETTAGTSTTLAVTPDGLQDGYQGSSNVVTTGALNSGSITSGFGNIDTGSSTIDTTGAVSTGEITSTSIRHSISGNNDGDYGPGAEIIYSIGTTSVTAGVIYALKDSTSGAEWVVADADIEASVHGLLAVATSAAGSTNSGSGMIIKGCVTLANAYTAGSDDLGKIVYASQTGGEATLTKPTAADKFVRILGYSLNVSDGTNQKMFFNPDSTYIKLS